MSTTPTLRLGLLIFCSSLLSLAAAQSLTLTDALAAAESRTDVINARLAQEDAQVALERTLIDPLALRLERTQAEQRAELSEAELTQARYQAQADISAAYTQLIEAQARLELAALARTIAQQTLGITEIRFDKGSATELDVQEARNDLEDADTTLRTAQQGTALARSSLASLVPQPFDEALPLEPQSLTDLPPLQDVRDALLSLPALLQVEQGADLAAINLDLLDPSYASQSQLEAARLQADQTSESLRETRRALGIQAQSLYNAVTSAAETLQIRRDALANAREREALEERRLEAGLIADINLKQAQLASQQAQIAALEAEHGYLNALLELQAGTMIPITDFMTMPDTAEPDVAEPDVAEPDIEDLEITEPDLTDPDAVPNTSDLDTVEPDTVEPDTTDPNPSDLDEPEPGTDDD